MRPRYLVLGPLLMALALLPSALPAQAPSAPPPLATSDASAMAGVLREAQAEGFEPGAFGPPIAEADLVSSDPATRTKAETRLKAEILGYARAEHGGRIAESRMPRFWALRPEAYDAQADFDRAAREGRLAAWAAALRPPDPRYDRLVSAYGRYRLIAARGGWPTLRMTTLKPGATGEAVRALRSRLSIEDPALAAPAPGEGLAYDQPLSEAVSRAQARYGLNVDGTAGPNLVVALNLPVERRLAQMRATLERLRWSPRALPADRVELNIPAAWFTEYEDGKPVLGMRAVVGRPRDPTPSFQDHIHSILFHPPWNVPRKIAVNELWPKGHGYLARNGFRRGPGGSLQQAPGPGNALGRVKFELDNPFAVYFHDTPSRNLFAREVRTLSHGCMRLEQPYDLAKRLLRTTPGWDAARIDAVLAGPAVSQRVTLAQPVMAYVVYYTAFVDDQGQVQFRQDVYGWDDRLLALLGEAAPTR